MQECQIFSVQGEIVLTFLGVKAYGFDLYMFLEASGTRWNQCCGLNRPRNWFSDLSFFEKIQVCSWPFFAQLGACSE